MAADADERRGDPEEPGGDSRGFLRSWGLIAGAFAAVVVEVLVLFGLGPLRIWVTLAIGVLLGGLTLAWVDSRQDDSNDKTKVIAVASLVVSILSLVLATVTIFNGFPALG